MKVISRAAAASQPKAAPGPRPTSARKKSRTRKDLELIFRKPRNKGEEFRRRGLLGRAVRWVSQIAFLLLFPGVWNACFNGVKYVFEQLGASQPLETTSFLTLLLVLLVYTIVFGRFFCGYACSFGTLGDLVYAAGTPLRKALKMDRHPMPLGLRYGLQLIKYAVLAAICILCFAGMWSAVSGYSPWVAWGGIIARSFGEVSVWSFVALVVVMAGSLFYERFFCQFLCPMGAVFSLMPVLPISLFSRDRPHCAKRCNRCQDRCPVGIHPDVHDLRSGECIACGRCADGCPVANITVAHTGNRWRLLRVGVKAAVLLVLLLLFA